MKIEKFPTKVMKYLDKKQGHEQYVFKLLCRPTITVVLVIDLHPESLPVVISQHYHHYTPLLYSNSICF